MNRILIILLLLCVALGASAQRRRRVKEPPPPTPEELAEIARQEKYDRYLQAIERVTFIDSMLLGKSELLEALSLGSENGSVHSCAEFFSRPGRDTLDCTLFQNQLKDKIVYAQLGSDTLLHLYGSEMISDTWTSPVPLAGLADTVDQNYPFMLSDGVTLYYAAKDPEGLGGYDIMMTRWDADAQTYLRPTNIGMPFNSEGNDYLYVMDEYNQLGWFATDRGYTGDTVCLYCFIPNETRRIYNPSEMGRDTLVAFASIRNIRDTWTDVAVVKDAKDRLEAFRTYVKKTRKVDFHFVVNDNIIYTQLSQFKHTESLKLAPQWLARTKERDKVTRQLDDLRLQYLSASDAGRSNLKPQILQLEQQYEQLLSAITLLEKEIRVFEQ